MESKRQESAVIVATKVNPEAAARLETISNDYGFTRYDILQSMIQMVISLMDKPKPLDARDQVLMDAYNDVAKFSMSSVDPSLEHDVKEAYYIFGNNVRRGGVYGCIVQPPFMGQRKISFNKILMMEKIVNYNFPSLYKRLRMIGSEEKHANLVETINALVREHYQGERYADDIDEIFGDNNRAENGRAAEYRKYKRTHDVKPKEDGDAQQFFMDLTDAE